MIIFDSKQTDRTPHSGCQMKSSSEKLPSFESIGNNLNWAFWSVFVVKLEKEGLSDWLRGNSNYDSKYPICFAISKF